MMDIIYDITNVSNNTNSSDVDYSSGSGNTRIPIFSLFLLIPCGFCALCFLSTCLGYLCKSKNNVSHREDSEINFKTKSKEEYNIIEIEEKDLYNNTNIDNEKENNNVDTCSICQNKIKNKIATECNHYFCKSCMLKHLSYRSNCPNCRQPITDTLYIIE